MKLQLSTVTLCCIDGVNAKRAENVIDHCMSLCDFGAVKLLTHLPSDKPYKVEIMPLESLIAYSVFCLTEMYKYFDTSHVLIVQRDGWILNPLAWNNEWLKYDYIGPLFVQHDDVGSGGFSMRSKAIMEGAARRYRKWDGTDADAHELQKKIGSYEDGVLALQMKYDGWKYAPLEQAAKFAAGGNKGGKYYEPYPYGFHGDRQEIDHATGFVSPVCEHDGEDCQCRVNHQKVLMEMGK